METVKAKLMTFHCIIYQQALCRKNTPLSKVINIVVLIKNYIRKNALSHHQLKNFFSEIEIKYPDILYHCEVHWLTQGNILKSFIYLCSKIVILMIIKNSKCLMLQNTN